MSVAAVGTMPRPNLLSILRHRDFALLWGGQAVSQFGDALFTIAQMWLALQLTGSALAMGTMMVLTLLPRLAFQLFGGVSVDRYDRKTIIFLSDGLRAVIVLLFAVLVATSQIQMVHLYVLAILFGIIGAFFEPAAGALLPNLVPMEGLVPANSLSALTRQIAQMIGPVLGGVLIAIPVIGIAGVSFMNAISFAAGAFGTSLIKVPAPANSVRRTQSSVWEELKAGLRYLLQYRALVIIFFLAMVLNFSLGPVGVLLPIFAKNVLGQGAEGFGLMGSAMALGMVAGSLGLGVWAPSRRRGILVFAITAVGGVLFMAIGLVPVFGLTLLLLALFGIGNSVVNTMIVTIVQAKVADEYRGRVFSLIMLIAMGLTPVAYALGGALADVFGPGYIMAAGGAMCVVASLGGLLFRDIRTLE